MVDEWVNEIIEGWIMDEWIPYYWRMNELISMDDD